jgi:hypothetical protein
VAQLTEFCLGRLGRGGEGRERWWRWPEPSSGVPLGILMCFPSSGRSGAKRIIPASRARLQPMQSAKQSRLLPRLNVTQKKFYPDDITAYEVPRPLRAPHVPRVSAYLRSSLLFRFISAPRGRSTRLAYVNTYCISFARLFRYFEVIVTANRQIVLLLFIIP